MPLPHHVFSLSLQGDNDTILHCILNEEGCHPTGMSVKTRAYLENYKVINVIQLYQLLSQFYPKISCRKYHKLHGILRTHSDEYRHVTFCVTSQECAPELKASQGKYLVEGLRCTPSC